MIDYKEGDIVVSLTNMGLGNMKSRNIGDIFCLMKNSSKYNICYKSGYASCSPEEWRLATPNEIHYYSNGIKNINQIQSQFINYEIY